MSGLVPLEAAKDHWYPAPCTNSSCPKIHRLLEGEQFHENALFIRIRKIITDTHRGFTLDTLYFHDQVHKENIEKEYNQEQLNRSEEMNGQYSSIVDVRGKIRESLKVPHEIQRMAIRNHELKLKTIRDRGQDISGAVIDYTIDPNEVAKDAINGTDVLVKVHAIHKQLLLSKL